MSSKLDGRVRALERQADRAAGCPDCGGALVIGVQDGEPAPGWLAHESRCRCCGNGVKLYRQQDLDKLASTSGKSALRSHRRRGIPPEQ